MINSSGYVESYLGVKRDNPGMGGSGVGSGGERKLFVKAPETGILGQNLEQTFCPTEKHTASEVTSLFARDAGGGIAPEISQPGWLPCKLRPGCFKGPGWTSDPRYLQQQVLDLNSSNLLTTLEAESDF